jgi:hypothetical protein
MAAGSPQDAMTGIASYSAGSGGFSPQQPTLDGPTSAADCRGRIPDAGQAGRFRIPQNLLARQALGPRATTHRDDARAGYGRMDWSLA